ncbi:hypothetical protein [Maribacter sp. R86514]|uniref:hypothetical protein n=1 Tax=Maribacter sp. R86514 TaxID=3093854 RepID=UPI0037C5DA6A
MFDIFYIGGIYNISVIYTIVVFHTKKIQMEINKLEKSLFSRWAKRRPEMAKDGVINESEYTKCKIKVLYILKEVNDWKNGDLREFVAKGARWRTWNNIARWQNGIQNYFDNGITTFKNSVNENDRKKILKTIAVLNLKKESGGPSSNMGQIWHHANEDKDLLKEQIDLYDPNIIICCGTGGIVSELQLFENIGEFKKTSNGTLFAKSEEKLVIQYLHPQCRKNKKLLFDNLLSSIEEIK